MNAPLDLTTARARIEDLSLELWQARSFVQERANEPPEPGTRHFREVAVKTLARIDRLLEGTIYATQKETPP